MIGQNPELADPGNPSGNVYGERFGVSISDSDGYEWHHFAALDSFEAADRLAFRVEHAIERGWTPDESEHWNRRTVYGGTAHDEREIAIETNDVAFLRHWGAA